MKSQGNEIVQLLLDATETELADVWKPMKPVEQRRFLRVLGRHEKPKTTSVLRYFFVISSVLVVVLGALMAGSGQLPFQLGVPAPLEDSAPTEVPATL